MADNNEEIKEEKQAVRARRRKKHIFNDIRNQMEFYFGDSNLSKDRFLKKLIDEDPFVPLDIFLTFNRMKNLTESAQDIATALGKSEILKLSEDKSKVRRITKINEKKDIDDYVIYVESLPPNADHDWIKNAFSIFGPVAYISLPRYQNKTIKGFAFIEFEHKSSIEKATVAFEEFQGLITTEKNPEELLSIVTFVKENSKEGMSNEKSKIQNDSNENKEEKAEEETPAKKIKLNEKDDELDVILTSNENFNESETEKSDNNVDEETESIEVEVKEQKSKKRKRVRRKRIELKKLSTPNSNDNITDLRITTKSIWKKLRNKYLNLQREKIKQIKKNFKKDNPSKTQPIKVIMKPQIKPTRNINFYGALNEDKKVEEEKEELLDEPPHKKLKQFDLLNKKPLFTYEPGIIVSIKFNEPCVDVKDFKEEMRQYNQVKYIDVKEGAHESFIRTDNPASAVTLIKQISSPEYSCNILTGNDEQIYWDKIKKDREDKLLKKIKIKPKLKNTNKIIKQSTHLRFDDE